MTVLRLGAWNSPCNRVGWLEPNETGTRGLSRIGSIPVGGLFMFRHHAFSLLLGTLLACGGGVGGNGTLQPFAISAAANPATAGEVHNLLESGDHYRFEPNNTAANA